MDEIAIRQMGNLYSLNDLHKASGSVPNQRPGEFMRNQQTQDLVVEISNAGISAFESKRGNNSGTYACRELVIAYAAWISAKFHLKVIRVFLGTLAPQSIPYAVQPGDKLDAKQQAVLRDLLESNVKRLPLEKQGPAIMRGWSKLKAHFKVSYRDIPADQFTDAVSLLSRHVAELDADSIFPAPSNELPAIDFDFKAELTTGQSAPKPLSSAIMALVQQCSWKLAAEAQISILQFLERFIAHRTTDATRNDVSHVGRMLEPLTLSHCLAHRYFSEVGRVQQMADIMQSMASQCVNSIKQRMGTVFA